MEDSSEDDFLDLPGPSTRARVKRKEWPDPDDPGGTTSKKVGGSGRTPQDGNSEEMTKEQKKKEAARIRKAQSRAKKDESQKAKELQANRTWKAKKKDAMSEESSGSGYSSHKHV